MADQTPDPLLASLFAAGSLIRFAQGERVFHQGDPPRALYWVLQGELRLLRRSSQGGETILQRCHGGPFAESSLYSPAYHCDGVAAQAGEAIRIPKARMEAMLDDPLFAQRYVRWLSASLREMRSRCERLSLPRAGDRVLHALAEQGVLSFGAGHGSLKDWAGELGLTHETLYRALAELERQGRIVRGAGQLALAGEG